MSDHRKIKRRPEWTDKEYINALEFALELTIEDVNKLNSKVTDLEECIDNLDFEGGPYTPPPEKVGPTTEITVGEGCDFTTIGDALNSLSASMGSNINVTIKNR